MSLTTYEKASVLDDVIGEITRKAKPEDVFDRDVLLYWASNQEPEEIFVNDELEKWAKDNGYVQKEEE